MGKVLAKSFLYALALGIFGGILLAISSSAGAEGKSPEELASETWRTVLFAIGIFAIFLSTIGYKLLFIIFEYKVLSSK